MASSDIKHDYSMEAGLLNTDREERIMSSKEALLQDSESAQTAPRTTRRISPAGKALIALAACCLLGAGVASIGGATRFCPGHLRHGDLIGKHGMNAHHSNLSESVAKMVRRQNTPGASDTAEPAADPTNGTADEASNEPGPTAPTVSTAPTASAAPTAPSNTAAQPSETNEKPTDDASVEQPSATQDEPSQQPSSPATNEPSPTQPSATQRPSSTNRPSATAQPTREDSATDDTPSATESDEEPTQPASNTAPTQQTTRRTTATQPRSTEESNPESTADSASDDQETETQTDEATQTDEEATATETESARSTVTGTGTRRTSSAVPKTYTSTLEDGGVTTLTSTSWVEVVPSAEATGSSNPDLQNAAPRSVGSVLGAVAGMIFGGVILL